jgi:hypothetical protein
MNDAIKVTGIIDHEDGSATVTLDLSSNLPGLFET